VLEGGPVVLSICAGRREIGKGVLMAGGHARAIGIKPRRTYPARAARPAERMVRNSRLYPAPGEDKSGRRPAGWNFFSNRRIRTRTYGGVGGAEPRGSPLSRSMARPDRDGGRPAWPPSGAKPAAPVTALQGSP
jgi:hypothetical protein